MKITIDRKQFLQKFKKINNITLKRKIKKETKKERKRNWYQSTLSKQMSDIYKETICWLEMSYLPTWLDMKYCTDISDHRRTVNG